MQKVIQELLQKSQEAIGSLNDACSKDILNIVDAILATYKNGGKVLIFGNGGSAADAQHFAAELIGRFKKERPAYAAIALTTNTSIITALSNDYEYAVTFKRQVEGLGGINDIAIGISTSGKAKNVIAGLQTAKDKGIKTAALTGSKGTNLKELCDICLCVPSDDTPVIQEAHIVIIHIICKLVEDSLAS